MSFLFHNKQIRKGFFIFIFVSIVFSSIPEKTNAQWITFDVPTEVSSVGGTVAGGTTAMKSVKDIATYIADKFARAITRVAIRRITQSTVNWINNGFKGNPSFVTDPGQFFLDVADTSASQMLSETSLNKLCTPFKAQVRLALVKNYLQDNNNYSCTLSTLKNNYEAFTQDFSQGGWEGWFEMTQTSGGNPYSAYFAAQNQLAIQVGNQQIKYQKQLDLGSGFLNFEKCKKGYEMTAQEAEDYNNMYGTNNVAGDCAPENMQTVTPGSVIEEQLQNSLGTGVRQMELSSELAHGVDSIINATIDTLIAQLFTRVLGDKGLLDNTHGNPSDTSPPAEPPISTAPSITLLGSSPTYVQINTTYRDPGVMAFDNTGQDISANIVTTGSVNTATLGTYTITYNVTSGGESSTMTRTVIVINDAPPSDSSGSTVKCTTDPASGEMTCTLGGGGGSGGQCTNTGNVYGGDLRSAMDAVLSENPNVASLPSTDANDRANARTFLKLVETKLQSRGLKATVDVLNGNNNPNTGDLIAVWKEGDTTMERYDAIRGDQSKTIEQTAQTLFDAFIPLNCYSGGGGNDCGCKNASPNTPSPTTPPTTPPKISCDTCAQKGQSDKYQSAIKSAANQYLTTHLSIANLDNYTHPTEVGQLRDAVITILNNSNLIAKTSLDSSGNPYPQMVEVRSSIDPDFTSYRVTAGNTTISEAIDLGYCGGHETLSGIDIIPNYCSNTPSPALGCGILNSGSAVRGCQNYKGATPVYKPNANSCANYCLSNNADACEWYAPNGDCYVENGTSCSLESGSQYGDWTSAVCTPSNTSISSISPTIATRGITIITINGSNLTDQVSFFDGSGGRNTVVGSVNSAKTQTTVLVPANQPIGKAIVEIYVGNQTWSKGTSITIQ